MAKKQTRRSISVNRKIYDAFKTWCEAQPVAMSASAENAIVAMMGFDPRTEQKVYTFQVTSDRPMVGNCDGCGVDLAALAADGCLGHACTGAVVASGDRIEVKTEVHSG